MPFESWCGGSDVDMADGLVEDVPVEAGLEFRAVVVLGLLDLEGQPRQDVVQELDRGFLV